MPVQWKNCQQGRFYAVALPLSCWWWLMVMTLLTATILNQGAVGDENLATKLASQETDPKCHNFSKGWKQTEDGGEFYSPNYPNNYFNNTECTLTLIAPMNHLIEVDFRDRFQIELSTDCQHDFLEIYDGLGGHRNRITPPLCGMKFPKERILSTGRFLYFRFKSDDTAEYGGFKAVFFFRKLQEDGVPLLGESCESIETGYDGVIGTKNFSKEFDNYFLDGNEINCLWMINVTKEYKVTLYFWSFALREPNSCEKNFLTIYTKRLDDQHQKDKYCGTQAKNITYKEVPVYLYLYGSPMKGDYSSFEVHYTIYRSLTADSSCTSDEFDCGDSSCIHKSLRCNGRYNCKYLTDEESCVVTVEKMFPFSENVMVILFIGLLLLLSLAVAMVVSCRRQWKELRKKREEVAARRSMPLGLDHLDPGQTTVMSITDDDHGCYVPEVDLSMFHKRSNGGNAIAFDRETALDRLDPFRRRDSRSSNGSTPPPPPPPKYANSLGDQPNNRTHTMNTLVMEEDEDEAADVFPPPNARPPDFDGRRFRAEAIIQMESQRPRSFESTKSAPDVIVRH